MDSCNSNTLMEEKKRRIQKYGEVFTPQKTVVEMCDMLEVENPGCFEPHTTFLEPTCGDGAFVIEILRRKFELCRTRSDYTDALKSVYGMEIQQDNVERCVANVLALCEEFFRPTKAEREIINDHIIMCDSLKVMKLLHEMRESEEKENG